MFIDRPDIPPGIKIAAQIRPEPSEDDLAFIKQMGVDYVVLWTDGEPPARSTTPAAVSSSPGLD